MGFWKFRSGLPQRDGGPRQLCVLAEMLILPWFWYSFVALCQFCVRFGTVYVASAADFVEMVKTQCVFDGFA